MSFSAPMPRSPIQHDIKFSKGQFTWWDKAKTENVEIQIPFKFVVLDTRSCITGWVEEHGSVRSNEVANLGQEQLVVNHWRTLKSGKSLKTHIATGIYKDIKETVTSKRNGGRFTTVLYIMREDGSIDRYYVSGSGLTAWIGKNFDPINEGCGIKIEDFETGDVNGKEYKIPRFTRWLLDAENFAKAEAADKKLQKFFKEYASWKAKQAVEEDAAKDDEGFERSTSDMDDANQALQQDFDDEEVPF